MTRQQAIKEMQAGKKVTHVFFATDEYVEMQDGKLIDESGYNLNWNLFWSIRTSPYWTTQGWSLYSENQAPDDFLKTKTNSHANRLQ